jgi:hypothetical protein
MPNESGLECGRSTRLKVVDDRYEAGARLWRSKLRTKRRILEHDGPIAPEHLHRHGRLLDHVEDARLQSFRSSC